MPVAPALLPVEQIQRPPAVSVHLVSGAVRYYHYGVDGSDDHGWGCGYRTVQTMLSWLSPELPPSLPTLQRVLSNAYPAVYPGPRGWIGVNDAAVLVNLLQNAEVKVLTIPSGQAADSVLAELAEHFDHGGGPVMVGGGGDPYSKTVLGVSQSPAALLVMDPHYSGTALTAAEAAQLEPLWAGAWIGWKPLRFCLPSALFYNFGLLRCGTCNSTGTSPQGGAIPAEWTSAIEVVASGNANDA
ncbi:hypothetical protein AB1Y20_001049 [Prymnesium parvum]|uniref:UFSP1/2/DUB catalytic domain-containing protein n=1 Tax=Prymnesium parvum TaxID=97485 RepID=A0AB34KBH2_PRYPA